MAFAERFPSTGSVSDSLILYLAYDAADVWLSFLDGIAPDTDVNGTTTTGATNFRKAFVLALANPYEILFWLTIGVGLLQLGTLGALA